MTSILRSYRYHLSLAFLFLMALCMAPPSAEAASDYWPIGQQCDAFRFKFDVGPGTYDWVLAYSGGSYSNSGSCSGSLCHVTVITPGDYYYTGLFVSSASSTAIIRGFWCGWPQ